MILSGKGGTGKTSVTAAFAAMAENAVFADCDVDASNLHLLLSPDVYRSEDFSSGAKAAVDNNKCTGCGICRDLCRFSAIEFKRDRPVIDEFACEGCSLCAVACPPGAIAIENNRKNNIYFANCRFGPLIYGKLGIAEENSGRLVTKIRQYAKDIAKKIEAEYIITDGPPGIGCPVISSVTGVDLVVAVTEPTVSGWHDLERLINLVGQFHTSVKVIINKYDLNKEMASAIENKLKVKGIELLGKIPYDESIVYALLEGKTINEFEPMGLVANEMKKMWNTITKSIYEPKSI